MFLNGSATIFVADMDRSVEFYTKVLDLKLAQRFGNHWASVEVAKLSIGLHPASIQNRTGRNGSTIVGFELAETIHEAVGKLERHGVKLRGGIIQDNAGKAVHFEDPDSNELYIIELRHWPKVEAGEPAYQKA